MPRGKTRDVGLFKFALPVLSNGARPASRWIGLAVLLLLASACTQQQFRREQSVLTVSSARLEFGATTLGVPVDQALSWVHRGRIAAEITAVRITPDDGNFSIAQMPRRVEVRGRAESTVTYLPRSAGVHRALLEVELADGSEAIRVVLEGKGVDARGVPQSDVKFGRPALGATRNRTLVFRNDFETGVPVLIPFRGPDAAEFRGPDQFWLPAYSEVTISLSYSPAGKVGPRDTWIELSACPLCALQRVEVSADAVPVPIAADPDHVDFGAVAVDTDRTIPVSLTNLTDEVITVSAVALSADTEVGFALKALSMPLMLLPEVPERVEVSYSPPHLNGSVGNIVVISNAQPTSSMQVPLRANGGGAQLIVEPRAVNFRNVPVGGRAAATINVGNGGANTASPPLTVTRVEISGAPFSLTQTIPAGTQLASGASLPLQVAFDPTAAGTFQGTVTVYSDDPLNPFLTATLTGTGRVTSECVLEVDPPAIDFGGVLPGAVGELGVRVTNAGSDLCTVSNARVSGNASFLLSKQRPQVTLAPGESFTTLVQFRPSSIGNFTGFLAFDTSRTTAPLLEVPLTAGSDGACLRPEPVTLFFGAQRRDCGTRDMTGRWRNTCTRNITVSSIAFGQGTDTRTFELLSTDPLPATLPPRGIVSATVRMSPATTGYQVWPLFAVGSDTNLPMLMAVHGEALLDAAHHQSFLQTQPAKIDLLWVVDNTASMDINRGALEANVADFLRTLDDRKVDYQIGVTTTSMDPAPSSQSRTCPGGVNGGEAGRLFPVDRSRPRIVTPSTPNRADVLTQNIAVGGCTTVHQGLRATITALSPPLIDNADLPNTPQPMDGNLGFLREDAALAVVVVSNQDDQSPNSMTTNIRNLRGLKPRTPMTFSAIVGPPSGCPSAVQPGLRYLEAVQALGGVSASVCASDWAANLDTIADGLFRARDTFPLEAPADPATIRVTVNGQPTSGWRYESTQQSLVFNHPPSPGASIEIDYSEPCPAP